ncbi:DUF6428 family protein [Chitinophagales bacterium]|nr:DUF6428 family protein [Chitinophagales bacterium]
MKVVEFKSALAGLEQIGFLLPDGTAVPGHFHVTEVGRVQKDFIDCGGTQRQEIVASLQLWEANDYDHRLHPDKLINIISLSEEKLGIGDWPVEVEYQNATIGKYDLDFDGTNFLLKEKRTACLALENCGIPVEKEVVTAENAASCCTPESGCC